MSARAAESVAVAGRTVLSPVPGARDPKLAERVAAALETDIIAASWPVGRVIGSEDQLTARYGVSRAVIREAVRLAEHRQIVRPRRGRGGGLVVVEPDSSAVIESLEIFLDYARVSQSDLSEASAVLDTFSGSDNPALALFAAAVSSVTRRLATTPSRAAGAVADRIRQDIADLGWPVGESLGYEADLLQRYGVGRAQFREAVRILENHSVVRMQRGTAGGMVVTAPDGRGIVRAASLYLTYQGITNAHIRDLRGQLEAATVQLTIERLTPAGTARLEDMLALETTWADGDFRQISHDLHAVIAELSGNQTLGLLQSIVMQLTAERLHSGGQRRVTEPPDAVRRAHRAIVQAIVARDVPLALRRMDKHLRAIARWTIERPARARTP